MPGITTGVVALAMASGCYTGLAGRDGDAQDDTTAATGTTADDGDDTGRSPPDPEIPGDAAPRAGLRRLSAREYDQSVRDLLGIARLPAVEQLPFDARTPFDNDASQQIASETLVNAIDQLAERAATELLADPALRDRLLGCVPVGVADEACMTTLIERLGRRALRRPLSPDDVEQYLHGSAGNDGALDQAALAGDFDAGVEYVVRAMLSDPEFIYRVEIGTPVEGDPQLRRLGGFEIAARMSYLLWGSGPDDELLDRAAAGRLETPDEVGEAARELLEDPRARARVERFHAMWLGYETMLVEGELGDAMRRETAALINLVVFDEQRVWQDIFRESQTFVDDALVQHYGLPPDGSSDSEHDGPRWVDYGDTGRSGLLSHGSFLALGAKGDDTSPVQRGLVIQKRLLCKVIPPPPPGVNTDMAPSSGHCKSDRYAQHRQGSCAGCHDQLDPVGFGLEAYDLLGRHRTHEADLAATPDFDESSCVIEADGEVDGLGEFSGPAELADLTLASGDLDLCVVQQVQRLAVGHGDLDDDDLAMVEAIRAQVGEAEFRLDDLLVAVVTVPGFGYRRDDVAPDAPTRHFPGSARRPISKDD